MWVWKKDELKEGGVKADERETMATTTEKREWDAGDLHFHQKPADGLDRHLRHLRYAHTVQIRAGKENASMCSVDLDRHYCSLQRQYPFATSLMHQKIPLDLCLYAKVDFKSVKWPLCGTLLSSLSLQVFLATPLFPAKTAQVFSKLRACDTQR